MYTCLDISSMTIVGEGTVLRSRLVTEGQSNLIESQSYDSHHRSLTSQRAYGPESLSLTY